MIKLQYDTESGLLVKKTNKGRDALYKVYEYHYFNNNIVIPVYYDSPIYETVGCEYCVIVEPVLMIQFDNRVIIPTENITGEP